MLISGDNNLCSGYDFGYMLKILTSQPLPTDESDFFDLVKMFFPNIYDVKYLMKSCKNLKGGLQEVADQLEVVFMACTAHYNNNNNISIIIIIMACKSFFAVSEGLDL